MAEILRQTVEDLVNSFNDRLSEWTHAEVALATLITTLSILFANNQLRGKVCTKLYICHGKHKKYTYKKERFGRYI